MTKTLISRFLAGLLLAVTAGCGSSPSGPAEIATIRATTSFGFCVGYCRTTLEIAPQQAVLIKEPLHSTLPTRRVTTPLTAAEWAALVEAVDRKRLESLPEVLGCPDCADGGAESLEVVGAGWQRKVTFEFGRDVAAVQPLLDRVRTLRQRLDP